MEQEWFIEEDQHNPGANYLIGVCLALDDFSGGSAPEQEGVEELKLQVRAIAENLDPSFWRFESLAQSEGWIQARALSQRLLAAENTWVRPPTSPFVIEKLIRVEHYLHAREVREHLGKRRC